MLHFKQGLPWIAAGFVAIAGASPSQAQGGAEFFKGKTVTYIVATAPGGGYDAYGRLVAEYMQKYLPGSTFVVKNMPGAGHVIGANAIYAAKPDGLTIGSFNTGLIYNQLIGLEGVRFDLTKMSWIGKAASDPRVITCAEHSPIKTFEDLRASKEPVKFATAGIGSASYVETVMLTNALRLPAKVLTGYNGNQDQLAMRRKEVDCTVASRSTYEQFVDNKYGRFVAQVGGADKDVPQLAPLVADPTGKQLIALIQSQTDIVRFTAGPPGIAGERLEVLRTAYRKALEDKELQAKAEKLERPVDPSYGEDVAQSRAGGFEPDAADGRRAQGSDDDAERGRERRRQPPRARSPSSPTAPASSSSSSTTARPSRPSCPARARRSPSPGRRPTATASRRAWPARSTRPAAGPKPRPSAATEPTSCLGDRARHSHGFASRVRRGDRLGDEPVAIPQGGKEPAPQEREEHARQASDHDGRRCADQRRQSAGLELAERIRGAREQRVHGAHPAAHGIGRIDLHERQPDEHAHHVGSADHEHAGQRQEEIGGQAEGQDGGTVDADRLEQAQAGPLPQRPMRQIRGRAQGAERLRAPQEADTPRPDARGCPARRSAAAPRHRRTARRQNRG